MSSLRETHTLRIYPFKWLEAFGITVPKEIVAILLRIIKGVRQEEAVLAPKKSPSQRVEGFVVTDDYKPPKKSRKVFMYASTLVRRLSHLELYRWFVDRRQYCYQLMRQGACDIPWPPGCFVPPGPLFTHAL